MEELIKKSTGKTMTNYPELSKLKTTQVDEASSSDSADYKFSDDQMKKGAEKLVKIEPLELKFAFEPNKKLSCSLYLSNTTKNLVAFQVFVNNGTNYVAEPNNGIILPHRTCGIKVETKARMKKIPADMKCNDLIKIESVVFTQWDSVDMKELFINKDQENYVQVCTLPVVYLYAPLILSPLPKLSYLFLTENGNLNRSDDQMMISRMELLKIDQQELNFRFEVNKKNSCTLQLTNVSEVYVAFKVKVKHPRKFCVQPSRGILLPGSSCDVIVTMQAQKKALSNVKHKEEFLIQSTIVSPRIVEEFVDRKMMISSKKEPLKINPFTIAFEANKQISYCLRYRNRTEHYMAFKVKATNPEKFCIQSSRNILFPGSSCDVRVTMQDQKALSVQHNEKFLIHRVVLSPKTHEEIVDWKMLNDAGGLIREYKLRAAYTFTNQAPFAIVRKNDSLDVSQVSLRHDHHIRRTVSSAFDRIFDSLGLRSKYKYKRL